MTARISMILGKPRGHRPRLQTLLRQALFRIGAQKVGILDIHGLNG